MNFNICEPCSLAMIEFSSCLVFSLIYREPSPMKLLKIVTILSSSLSKNRGKKAIPSRIFTTASLIGMALEV